MLSLWLSYLEVVSNFIERNWDMYWEKCLRVRKLKSVINYHKARNENIELLIECNKLVEFINFFHPFGVFDWKCQLSPMLRHHLLTPTWKSEPNTQLGKIHWVSPRRPSNKMREVVGLFVCILKTKLRITYVSLNVPTFGATEKCFSPRIVR